jgi:hypothetical protein
MKDHRINWQMPAQPLGPAIRTEEGDEFTAVTAFEQIPHNYGIDADGEVRYVDEAACRRSGKINYMITKRVDDIALFCYGTVHEWMIR